MDSLQVAKWQSRALTLSRSNPDSALYYSKLALEGSKELENGYLISKSYNIKGIYFDVQSAYDSALHYYAIAIDLAEKCDCQSVHAGALNNTGLVYWNQGENERAIEYYKKALTIFEDMDKTSGMANAMNNIGLILWDQRYYEEALSYQKQALALRMTIDDRYGMGASFTNIGLLFSEMQQFDSSNYYLFQAVDIKKELNDQHGLAIVYTNLGSTQRLLNRPSASGSFFKKAIAIHRKLGNKRLLAANLSSLGNSYTSRKLYDSAEVVLLEAEEIASEIEAGRELYGIYIRLGRNYKYWGKHSLASDYLDMGVKAYQQVYDTETNEQIAEIKEKYESEKNKKEIAEQRAQLVENEAEIQLQNYLNIIFILLTFSILTVFIIVYKQQRFRHQVLIEENELKDKLAQEQVKNKLTHERLRISQDLHDNIGSQLTFIISSIDNLLFRYQKGEKDVQGKLSELNRFTQRTIRQLRDTIWAMNRDVINESDLHERLFHLRDMANKSLDKPLVQVEFDENASFSFNSLQGIEVYRIIQEALNNSLKYAEADSIVISTHKSDVVRFSVVDNGKGFDNEHVKSGNGLGNMKNRATKIGANLNIESTPNKGTTISITLKD